MYEIFSCEKCKVSNLVNFGAVDDLTHPDIYVFECWNCNQKQLTLDFDTLKSFEDLDDDMTVERYLEEEYGAKGQRFVSRVAEFEKFLDSNGPTEGQSIRGYLFKSMGYEVLGWPRDLRLKAAQTVMSGIKDFDNSDLVGDLKKLMKMNKVISNDNQFLGYMCEMVSHLLFLDLGSAAKKHLIDDC